jgi:hypothetical protein
MKWPALLAAVLAAACTTAPPPGEDLAPASAERPSENREWSDRQIQEDVEQSVRERFGEAALGRARAADAVIMSKLYRGMPLPPKQQPDGSWVAAPHPVALMVREKGQWLKAGESGFAPADAPAQIEVEALLGSAAFWGEAARIPQGGCTDGGSTLFVIRMPRQEPQVRQGTCGGPPLHNRLISAVY